MFLYTVLRWFLLECYFVENRMHGGGIFRNVSFTNNKRINFYVNYELDQRALEHLRGSCCFIARSIDDASAVFQK